MSKPKSKLGNLGVLLTAIYFGVILIIICFTDLVNIAPLSMNELGDFLAGVFGPPALVWVVISFYLQSAELQNSVNALNLQAEELSKSVEQQIAMVDLTRESISHEKEKFDVEEEIRRASLQPIFNTNLGAPVRAIATATSSRIGLTIKNIGALATESKIYLEDGITVSGSFNFPREWSNGDEYAFNIQFGPSSPPKLRHIVEISYKDSEGVSGKQEFAVYPSRKSIKITTH